MRKVGENGQKRNSFTDFRGQRMETLERRKKSYDSVLQRRRRRWRRRRRRRRNGSGGVQWWPGSAVAAAHFGLVEGCECLSNRETTKDGKL